MQRCDEAVEVATTASPIIPSRRVTTLVVDSSRAFDRRAPHAISHRTRTTAQGLVARRGITDKRHTRVGAAQRGAGTFPARDPRPAEVRGRRHSHAGVFTSAETPRKFDTVPRRRREGASRPPGIRTFIRFVRARGCPLRVYTPAIYYRVTRT